MSRDGDDDEEAVNVEDAEDAPKEESVSLEADEMEPLAPGATEEEIRKHRIMTAQMKAINWGVDKTGIRVAFGVGAALVLATAVIQLLLTELTTGATAGSVVNVIISENLPLTNFKFAQYPIDIFTGTGGLVVGVVLAATTYFAPRILRANYFYNDMWLRTFIGVMTAAIITFWEAQVWSIIEVLGSILPLVGIATVVPLWHYFQERFNARALPGQYGSAMIALKGGKRTDNAVMNVLKEEGLHHGLHSTSWLALNASVYTWLYLWIPLLAFSIMTIWAQWQAQYGVDGTLCHPRMWFSITTLVVMFVLEVLYGVLLYVRFSPNSLKLRRPLIFEGIVFLYLKVVIPIMVMDFLTFGLGYSVHVAITGC